MICRQAIVWRCAYPAKLCSLSSVIPHREPSAFKNSLWNQWMRLLRWLDYSGLALYFSSIISPLRRLVADPYPSSPKCATLVTNDTHARMIAESTGIQRRFQDSQVRYAAQRVLWPRSVPKLELRSQFDLDFLVSAVTASAARTVLESSYRLYGISGNSLSSNEMSDRDFPLRTCTKIYSPESRTA